jgi:hypothetical protein
MSSCMLRGVAMFDEYQPVPPLACPGCGAAVMSWHGMDGPCRHLIWRQGSAAPVEQRATPGQELGAQRLAELRLPAQFSIKGMCSAGHSVTALGRCSAGGVWNLTAATDFST